MCQCDTSVTPRVTQSPLPGRCQCGTGCVSVSVCHSPCHTVPTGRCHCRTRCVCVMLSLFLNRRFTFASQSSQYVSFIPPVAWVVRVSVLGSACFGFQHNRVCLPCRLSYPAVSCSNLEVYHTYVSFQGVDAVVDSSLCVSCVV